LQALFVSWAFTLFVKKIGDSIRAEIRPIGYVYRSSRRIRREPISGHDRFVVVKMKYVIAGLGIIAILNVFFGKLGLRRGGNEVSVARSGLRPF
jgi:hypothetical protein